MRTLRWAGLVVLLAGCGRQNWEGKFVGSPAVSGFCQGGSAFPETLLPTEWNITQRGTELKIVPAEPFCGVMTATAWGHLATVQAKTCTPFEISGVRIQQSILESDISLSENGDIEVGLKIRSILSGGGLGSCPQRLDGTLRFK